jgi:hypothetical protein
MHGAVHAIRTFCCCGETGHFVPGRRPASSRRTLERQLLKTYKYFVNARALLAKLGHYLQNIHSSLLPLVADEPDQVLIQLQKSGSITEEYAPAFP